MARIGLNISISGLTGELIIRWVKASAPLAEVGRSSAFPFPYDDVYNITDLNPVVYIVQLWRSDDGVSLDQLIKDWAIDASIYNETTITTYQYLTGRGWDNTTPVVTTGTWEDPAPGDTVLNDTRLDGATQDELLVHESGFGNKLNSEYDLVTGGGIELLDGKQFDEGVAWFITRTQTVAQQITQTGGSSMFTGVEVLTANQDFDDVTTPLANKLVIANWAGSVGTIVFPDLSLIADDTHVTFNTHGGSQNYLVLQFDSGDTVKFLNQNVNIIYLAKCEKISLYFFGGVCYVIDYDGRAMQRGNVLNDFDTSRATDTDALLLADEATGELNESDYPGLYAEIEDFPSGTVPLGTAIGEWSYDSGGGVYPNKRFFGIKTTAPKKLRVPHLSGVVAKYGSTPGTYEADNVGSFTGNISMPKGNSYTGAPNVARMGNGNNNPVNIDIPFTYVAAITETRVKSFQQTPYIIL